LIEECKFLEIIASVQDGTDFVDESQSPKDFEPEPLSAGAESSKRKAEEPISPEAVL
jgi:hypothetical protein